MAPLVRRLVALGARSLALLLVIVAVAIAPLPRAVPAETCCCPRPAECKCPEHQPGGPKGPTSIRRCSRPIELTVAIAAAPAVAPGAVLSFDRPAPRPESIAVALPAPHAAPDLERPRGPS